MEEAKLYPAYYMTFDKKYTGNRNKYGGLPTHLPPEYPTDERFGQMTFLCQIYCDEKMLKIPDTLCLQVYQLFINGMEASDPIVVQVPLGAAENTDQIGLSCSYLPEGDILFRETTDEITKESIDQLIDTKGNHLTMPKLGGWSIDDERDQSRFLGQIHDGDYETGPNGAVWNISPFNWGCGSILMMYLNDEGKVEWNLW